ncbi:M48 family metalloprotease [Clostridium tarantellae]|uniref:M48 family metalloprotease n=1 Tax=Clostridium tarantellae TaxID=39493 RepID=A0A6I1MQK1_9CLOT|nr:M48 family metalloprotease [Clostridium tarantellae]MPQ44768.1 M48 family metalloprotease [Clostridium tarantellae]
MKLFYELKEALTKKSNRGLIIYLLANFIVVWLLLGKIITSIIFGDLITSFGISKVSQKYSDIITVLSIPTIFSIYYLGLISSLTSLGEWFLRIRVKAKKITNESHKARLYPIFDEVYKRVLIKNPEVSKDIKLFITDNKIPNAFAAGKNTIILTTGLLTLSDEQIKGILAHEFAHIVNKDTTLLLLTRAGNILFNIYVMIATFICYFVGSFFSDHKRGNYTIPIILRFIFVGVIEKLLNLLYLFSLKSSRENEYEADKYSAQLGYGESLAVALDLICNEDYITGFMEDLKASHPKTHLRIERLESIVQFN